MKRLILLFIGIISTGLGTLGIFLPILPTTPFLLLALWAFAKSSKRCENFIRTNRFFGHYIDDYSKGEGIPLRAKRASISLLWVTILTANFAFIPFPIVKAFLTMVAIFVTVHILGNPTKINESCSSKSKTSISNN